ncbi:MAG: carboxyl transferase domain-containing protein [Actinomycetota bacterium]
MTDPVAGMIPFFVDSDSYLPFADDLQSADPLAFPDYLDELARLRDETGAIESISVGSARIGGIDVQVAEFDFRFFGGSMGTVTGERLARALERAAASRTPFVLRTATGGARMQEGMASPVQMPKLVAARRTLAEAATPLIALLGNPTTGGVLASIAGLADVIIAEAGATVGFAGPRLVEQVAGRGLRRGSHTSESAAAAGLVDAVVSRSDVGAVLTQLLEILSLDQPQSMSAPPALLGIDELPDGATEPWAAYENARSPRRPRPGALLEQLGDLFHLRGDRAGADDEALVVAIGRIRGRRAAVLALNREMPGPAAYRKARRVIAIAARLNLPVVTLIDTPGASPLEDSEAGGVAWEIASLFDAVLDAPVRVLSIVTGEGGSGGALAFACGDVLLAFKGSVFSVIGPELAAQLLWRDPNKASEAARLQRPTAEDLVRFGIADALVDADLNAISLGDAIAYHLDLLRQDGLTGAERSRRRRERWRR